MKYEDFMKSKTIELAGEYQIIHNPLENVNFLCQLTDSTELLTLGPWLLINL